MQRPRLNHAVARTATGSPRASTPSRASASTRPRRASARAAASPSIAALQAAGSADPALTAAPAGWPAYLVDLTQRTVLFLDLLRQRGDDMLAHEAAGLPPLLAFSYETVLDARTFEAPAAYALLRIEPAVEPRKDKRPVIVFDPRAGHGPGIGGFKPDSEVGMALALGHPVYFVAFFPDPLPGQTLAEVHHALRRFVREVAQRHPGQPPVLYGNCQAGWAVALMSADCAGMTGPAVLNGSPLSYWAGDDGVNPMRLAGGLTGGTWVARLLADLADGRFDGAWLVQNFEQLNPARALIDKYGSVLADPEGEAERFLAFERWWGGFYFLNREEIVAIVERLFVGNRLEQGRFQVCPCCVVDLHRIRNPLLIFASAGDNITPPQQALGWVRQVWPTTEALVAAGQRIVYLLHPVAGHLGIFVSSEVARREHRAMLAHINALESLPPGLYQMQLGQADDSGVAAARFEPRRVEDLPIALQPEAFAAVSARSEALDALYQQWISPWICAWANPWSAQLHKWSHPLRVDRYRFASAFNPWALSVRLMAEAMRAQRQALDRDSPWIAAERQTIAGFSDALENGVAWRDAWCDSLFGAVYGRAGTDVGNA